MKRGNKKRRKVGAKNPPAQSSSRAKRLVSVAVLGLLVVLLAVLGKWRLDEYARANWEARKAVITFVKTEAAERLPEYTDYEAYFFFKNRDGGNVARGVHSNDPQLLLISPDQQTCASGIVPDLKVPTDIGPGQIWNMRVAVNVAAIRDMNMTAEFRATIEYVEGIDPDNKERTATTPFCQRSVYDHSKDQMQWVSCLQEPTPSCTKYTN